MTINQLGFGAVFGLFAAEIIIGVLGYEPNHISIAAGVLLGTMLNVFIHGVKSSD